MTTNNTNLNEAFLDNAATEAIGAHGVEESDAFTLELAKADEAHRQAARGMRDTVARMAGAAPYLAPPARLRGAILEATAPKTFKIDDYRRSADVSPKWLRRSLVACIGFLIFAAWYNSNAKTTIDQLTQANKTMREGVEKARISYDGLVKSNQELQTALTGSQAAIAKTVYANPNAPRGYVQDPAGKKFLIMQDPATAQYFVMVPDQFVPANQYVALQRKDADGSIHDYKALLVAQPDSGFGSGVVASSKPVDATWQGITNQQTPPSVDLINAGLINH